jgi:hypothetical protein
MMHYYSSKLGPVWFVSPSHPYQKIGNAKCPPPVWFVANYLAAYGPFVVSFTDFSQNYDNPWEAESFVKSCLANFGRSAVDAIQTGQATLSY